MTFKTLSKLLALTFGVALMIPFMGWLSHKAYPTVGVVEAQAQPFQYYTTESNCVFIASQPGDIEIVVVPRNWLVQDNSDGC